MTSEDRAKVSRLRAVFKARFGVSMADYREATASGGT